MRARELVLVVASAALLAGTLNGCASGEAPGRDSGPRDVLDGRVLDGGDLDGGDVDAALVDASQVDAIVPETDGGTIDAFVPVTPDAGTDAGPSDAGPIDAFVPSCSGDGECSSLTTMCATGKCMGGRCTAVAVPNNTGCETGNRCMINDRCQSGVCVEGTVARDCSAGTSECVAGICNPATGCATMNVTNGTACGTVTGCSGSGSCQNGACTPSATTSPDCTPCGSGNYCASGVCGPNPTMGFAQGFEGGTALPARWTSSGNMPWRIEASGAHSGGLGARSGPVGNNQTSALFYSTPVLGNPAALSFWFKTSSELDYDYLTLLVDGTFHGRWSGNVAWTQVITEIPAGTHSIEWRWKKDAATAGGTDAVWIDDVSFGPVADPSTTFEGTSFLAAHYVSSNWILDATSAHSPTNGAHSGTTRPQGDDPTRGESSLVRAVTLPTAATVTFWYRVSSEACGNATDECGDHLRIYVDGVERNRYEGDVPWTMGSYALAAGYHVIEWKYSKDQDTSARDNRVYVDDVSFGTVPGAGPLCGP